MLDMVIRFMKEMIKPIQLVYFLIFSVGVTFGWLGFLLFGDIASSCNAVIVSKAALLELEQKRIKLEDGSFDSKDMFFGNQKEFLDLVVVYSGSFRDKKTKVLIVSDDSGNLYGGENITKEVYDAVVRNLQNRRNYLKQAEESK